MQKPNRFTAIHNKTKEIKEFNNIMFRPRKEWKETETKGTFKEIDNWTIYEDLRYKAKLRLYNYLTYTKKGLKIPRYKPFEGTEIGKSIPILNF